MAFENPELCEILEATDFEMGLKKLLAGNV
jgi:hypothetical protein